MDKGAVASIVVFSTIFAGKNDKYSGVVYYICRKYYKKGRIIVQKKSTISQKKIKTTKNGDFSTKNVVDEYSRLTLQI